VFAAAGDGGSRRRGRLSGLCAWTEALQLVKAGGKSRLVCPADLAYANQRWPPLIKPAATLVFEIKEWGLPRLSRTPNQSFATLEAGLDTNPCRYPR